MNTSKVNKFLPGSHIKILSHKEIKLRKPDYIVILPWNIFDEIKINFTILKMEVQINKTFTKYSNYKLKKILYISYDSIIDPISSHKYFQF